MSEDALHRAIYSRLANFPEVSSRIVAIYEESGPPPPDSPESENEFPYLILGPHVFSPFETDDMEGERVAVNIHLYDRFTDATTQRSPLRNAIKDALHRYDLNISGVKTVDCLYASKNGFPDPDGKTFHSVLQFRVTYMEI